MSLTKADKEQLLEQLNVLLQSRVEDFTRIARETARGATHEEAKPEDDKDTRALEQTYLARGQAERVAAAEHELSPHAPQQHTHTHTLAHRAWALPAT